MYVLSSPPEDGSWQRQGGAAGRINAGLIANYCEQPKLNSPDHILVMVSGRTQMYDDICGPRHVNGFMPAECALSQLGYGLNDVYKF